MGTIRLLAIVCLRDYRRSIHGFHSCMELLSHPKSRCSLQVREWR